MFGIEDVETVRMLKSLFAPDGGAEREHNAQTDSLGFGTIQYSLVTNLRPHRALVIGSRYGFIPCIIGLAQRANGRGEVDFVDANYDDAVHGFNRAYGGVGHWTRASECFAQIGLGDIVHLHVMRSDQFFGKCKSRYGYIYLDGDHSYEGCRYDFEQACRTAETGAVIVLHDVLVTQPEFGVGQLFDSLDPAYYSKVLIDAWPGLGLVQPRK